MKQLIIILSLVTSLTAMDRISVYKLDPINISDTLTSIISDRIEFELQQLDRFDLVERQNIDKILSEQSFQRSGVTDSMVEIGKILNIKYMLIGSFGKLDHTTWFISLKLLNVETAKISTGYYTVDASFKNFLLSAPKMCIKQLLGLVKIDQTSTISEEKAPATQINVIKYIQKDQPHPVAHRHFVPCYYCNGAGVIHRKLGTINADQSCPACNGFKYSGPETNYKLVAGKWED